MLWPIFKVSILQTLCLLLLHWRSQSMCPCFSLGYPTNIRYTCISFIRFTFVSNVFVIWTPDNNFFLSNVAQLMPHLHLIRHPQTITKTIWWGHLMSINCIQRAITNNFLKLFDVATIVQPKARKKHWRNYILHPKGFNGMNCKVPLYEYMQSPRTRQACT